MGLPVPAQARFRRQRCRELDPLGEVGAELVLRGARGHSSIDHDRGAAAGSQRIGDFRMAFVIKFSCVPADVESPLRAQTAGGIQGPVLARVPDGEVTRLADAHGPLRRAFRQPIPEAVDHARRDDVVPAPRVLELGQRALDARLEGVGSRHGRNVEGEERDGQRQRETGGGAGVRDPLTYAPAWPPGSCRTPSADRRSTPREYRPARDGTTREPVLSSRSREDCPA